MLSDLCDQPRRLETPGGYPTGFVYYADGTLERVADVPVDPSMYDQTIDLCELPEHSYYWGGGCITNADCGDATRDRCVFRENDWTGWCECITLCSRDGDCGDGEICLWPPVDNSDDRWPKCWSAAAWSAADGPVDESSLVADE